MTEKKHKAIVSCSSCYHNLYWWKTWNTKGGPLACENIQCLKWHVPQGFLQKELEDFFREKGLIVEENIVKEGGTKNVRDSQEDNKSNQGDRQADRKRAKKHQDDRKADRKRAKSHRRTKEGISETDLKALDMLNKGNLSEPAGLG